MEEKSRIKFIVIIALILAAAVFYSFAVNIVQEAPQVGLADVNPDPDAQETPSGALNGVVQVEVTPETVQKVVETLDRYTSYSRTVSVEYLSGGDVTGTVSAVVAVDGGWTSAAVTGQNGMVEHTIVGDGSRWLWFDDDVRYVQAPAEESSADLAQRLPTYEDVLAVDQSSITAADYVVREGLTCIYVEVEEPELGYFERFWVSVESGLLVAAETVKGDEVVYRMSSFEVVSPLSGGEDGSGLTEVREVFTLPDGTELHQVGG